MYLLDRTAFQPTRHGCDDDLSLKSRLLALITRFVNLLCALVQCTAWVNYSLLTYVYRHNLAKYFSN